MCYTPKVKIALITDKFNIDDYADYVKDVARCINEKMEANVIQGYRLKRVDENPRMIDTKSLRIDIFSTEELDESTNYKIVFVDAANGGCIDTYNLMTKHAVACRGGVQDASPTELDIQYLLGSPERVADFVERFYCE